MNTTCPYYTREDLARVGLTIAAHSATRGDYVMGPPATYGRLVGISAGGCAVVAWGRDAFGAKCDALDAARRRAGERIDRRAASLKSRIGALSER